MLLIENLQGVARALPLRRRSDRSIFLTERKNLLRLVEGFGEVEPVGGGGVRGRDGEVNIGSAPGLAVGAGAEDADFAHAMEPPEGAADRGSRFPVSRTRGLAVVKG